MEGEEEAGGGIYSGDARGEGEDGGEGGVAAVWTEVGTSPGLWWRRQALRLRAVLLSGRRCGRGGFDRDDAFWQRPCGQKCLATPDLCSSLLFLSPALLPDSSAHMVWVSSRGLFTETAPQNVL
jgi:hypothetical protein